MAGFGSVGPVSNVVGIIAGAVVDEASARVPKPWVDGICDCCEDSSGCCDVTFCHPCQAARQCEAMDGRPNKMDVPIMLAALIVNGPWPVLSALHIRVRMVEKYNIVQELPLMTAGIAVVLAPWSLCQTSRMQMALGLNPAGTCCQPKEVEGAGMLYPVTRLGQGAAPH